MWGLYKIQKGSDAEHDELVDEFQFFGDAAAECERRIRQELDEDVTYYVQDTEAPEAPDDTNNGPAEGAQAGGLAHG